MNITIGELDLHLSGQLLVSIGLFTVSFFTFLYTLSARPSILLSVSSHLTYPGEVYQGDVLAVYNAGRKGTLITRAGIRNDDSSLFQPQGTVGSVAPPKEEYTFPMVLGAGEAILFPFGSGLGPERELARINNGYEVEYHAPRSITGWKRYSLQDRKTSKSLKRGIPLPFSRTRVIRASAQGTLGV